MGENPLGSQRSIAHKENNSNQNEKVEFIYQIVPVAGTVFVIPAEAGIQLFRSGSLLSQG